MLMSIQTGRASAISTTSALFEMNVPNGLNVFQYQRVVFFAVKLTSTANGSSLNAPLNYDSNQ